MAEDTGAAVEEMGQDTSTAAGAEEEVNEVEVDGVKYTLDAEGNHCLAGVKVLDEKGVPFYNRSREFERKATESEDKYFKRLDDLEAQHRAEIERLSTTKSYDPEDIESTTGLTYAQLKAIEKRIADARAEEVRASESRTLNVLADNQVAAQKAQAKQDGKLKTFFANPTMVSELDQYLEGLTLQDALRPDIVRVGIKAVMAGHLDEIVKKAEERGRGAEREQREIVSEVQLGRTSGPRQGTKIAVTPEIREFAADTGLSLAEAADVMAHRQVKREARK